MQLLILLVLVVIFCGCVILDSVHRALPIKELRRRARSKSDQTSSAVYKLSSYGGSVELLLWLLGSLSAAGILLITFSFSWWFVLAAALVMGWLVWKDRPKVTTEAWQWRASKYLAPPLTTLTSILHPVLGPLSQWLTRRKIMPDHSGIYEKEDLLEFITNQNNLPGNRIPESDLKIAYNALTFGDKTVDSVMTPKRVVKMAVADDVIGPHLMDELHGSGFSRFPVIKEQTKAANPEVVGILYLKDLLVHGEKGKVSDVMKKKAYYINETQSLREALAAFLSTEHHMLIVVNNFEEITGVLTIEDVLEQVLGEKIVDEFDKYDDMRAVAGIEAAKDRVKHTTPEVIE
jgi:CBS domain containing-hemolysin-like protein